MRAIKDQIVYQAIPFNTVNVWAVRELKVSAWGNKVAKFYDAGFQLELKDGEAKSIFPTREEAETFARDYLGKTCEARVAEIVARVETGRRTSPSLIRGVEDYKKNGARVMDYEAAKEEALKARIAREEAHKQKLAKLRKERKAIEEKFHKQDNLSPEDFTYVSNFCHGVPLSEEYAEHAEMLLEDLDATFAADGQISYLTLKEVRELANPNGRFAQRGTCDHCGAHFNYGAVFKHASGEHFVVGNTCAFNNMGLTKQQYADKHMRKLVEAARKRLKTKVERKKNEAAIADLPEALRNALNYEENYFCQSIRENFIKWGKLSDRQIECVVDAHKKSLVQEANRKNQEAKDAELLASREALPVTDERITFEGEVVGIKEVDVPIFGSWNGGTEVVLKMIVLDDRGFKVYGSVPSKCSDYVGELVGMRIQFNAKVSRATDDKFFGFFKRPTKVSVLNREKREA